MLVDTLAAVAKWLGKYAKRIARRSLRPAATEEQLLQLEQVVGCPLPADFRQLYRWHDGLTEEENMGSLFYGMDCWPIATILAAYQAKTANHQPVPVLRADPQLATSNLFNPGWLQFCSDGSRTGLYLDLAPSRTGTNGQILFIDPEYETGLLVAHSTTDLAAQFLADLTAGLYTLEPDALEDGEHFLLPDSTIDLLNWQQSTRWQR